jgi:osmotically-inducible protein OsmY
VAIITISRGTMSGGRQLAEMLAERLGYRCVSREIVVEAAWAYGVPEAKLSEAILKGPSFLQKLTFERERYLAYIQATLCEYAVDDNLVYHGHGGHLLLEGVSHVLKVRIVASMSYRIKAAMDQFGFIEEEAEKYIKKVDKERVKWTKFLYGKDWTSPDLYDMVFNLRGMDLDLICEMVQLAANRPQFQATPESLKALRDLTTASKVRAALAGTPGVKLSEIEVKADSGSVVILGRARSQDLLDAIVGAAEKVAGVERVENRLDVDYHSQRIE